MANKLHKGPKRVPPAAPPCKHCSSVLLLLLLALQELSLQCSTVLSAVCNC